MSYQVQILDKDYNQELLALSQARNTGSALFNTDRSPDFFALSEELGETTYFGILKGNQLLGAIGLARQTRIINNVPAPVFYIFDLKVEPGRSNTPLYYRLVKHVVDYCRNVEKVSWVFSTILDSNVNRRTLTRGAQLLPEGRLIGKNYHIGFPVFILHKSAGRRTRIKEIAPEEAWPFYLEQTRDKNFAPADKAIFLKANGFFLGCFARNELVAVAKIIDQAHARKIYLTQPQPFSFRLLNLLCRFYKCPLLPGQNQVFQHGYLGYYAAGTGKDYRKAMVSYIQKNYAGRFSYIFTGMTEKEARNYEGPLLQKFTSSNYGYGEMPSGLTLDAVELTLI